MGIASDILFGELREEKTKPLTKKQKEKRDLAFKKIVKKSKKAHEDFLLSLKDGHIDDVVEHVQYGDYLVLLVNFYKGISHFTNSGGYVYVVYKGTTWDKLKEEKVIYASFKQLQGVNTPIAYLNYSPCSVAFLEIIKNHAV